MQIDYLPPALTGLTAGIGMMAAPGQDRPLIQDLDELHRVHKATLLVSLVSDHELQLLKIGDLLEQASTKAIAVIRFPIEDFSAPTKPADLLALVKRILHTARAGHLVVIHCAAGRGRTGLVAAACLVARGLSPHDAITSVRRFRSGAIETNDQEQAVHDFAAVLQTALKH